MSVARRRISFPALRAFGPGRKLSSAIAVEQRLASQTGSIMDVHATVDDRNRVLTTLLTVERELKALRQLPLAGRQALADLPAFQEVVDRHNEAVDLVADIIAVDRDSLDALKEAEQAGRVAGHALEHGDSTRAADRSSSVRD